MKQVGSHWLQRKNCWQILSILSLIFFRYCHFSIDWLILIFLFSPSLHFLHSHLIFYSSFCTKSSFLCSAFQFHPSQTLSASVFLATGLSFCTLKKSLLFLYILHSLFYIVIPSQKSIIKILLSDQLKQYIEWVNVTFTLFLTFPPPGKATTSYFSSWIHLFSWSSCYYVLSSHSSLALFPLCVQTCCSLTVPASGSNPSSPPTPFRYLPRHLFPSLPLLSLLLCLLFPSSQCWISPWTHAGGCMLTGWHWVKAKPTPAVCQASPSCRPPTAHSLLATWLLTCWWPTWLSLKADTTGHAQWSLVPTW